MNNYISDVKLWNMFILYNELKNIYGIDNLNNTLKNKFNDTNNIIIDLIQYPQQFWLYCKSTLRHNKYKSLIKNITVFLLHLKNNGNDFMPNILELNKQIQLLYDIFGEEYSKKLIKENKLLNENNISNNMINIDKLNTDIVNKKLIPEIKKICMNSDVDNKCSAQIKLLLGKYDLLCITYGYKKTFELILDNISSNTTINYIARYIVYKLDELNLIYTYDNEHFVYDNSFATIINNVLIPIFDDLNNRADFNTC